MKMGCMMKMSPFTDELLNSVDQERYREALYVLRHSLAAREMFANAQMAYSLANNDSSFFSDVRTNLNCLEKHAREVVHRKWWRRGYHNPFRILPPSAASFRRLVEELDVPNEKDEWGDEDLCRTILGWWQY